jgi:hypothetical protein
MHPYEPPDLPAAFPQLNTGVVAVRRTPRTRAVIERGREIYAANPHHRHDQPALREAVYRSDVAVHALPPEYNFPRRPRIPVRAGPDHPFRRSRARERRAVRAR